MQPIKVKLNDSVSGPFSGFFLVRRGERLFALELQNHGWRNCFVLFIEGEENAITGNLNNN